MEIGSTIKRLRKSRTRLNQTEFAEAINVTQAYLSLLESGKKTPSIGMLEKIGIEIDVPLPILFWFSITEHDIQKSKKEHFKFLKSSLDEMIDSII